MDLTWIVIVVFGLWLAGITVYLVALKIISRRLASPVVSPAGFRFSLHKFDPFSDTGGQQSFVISLLDGGGSGILLTSLHGRGMTRIYAKKVLHGKSDQDLSAEEKQALAKALNEKTG